MTEAEMDAHIMEYEAYKDDLEDQREAQQIKEDAEADIYLYRMQNGDFEIF